MTEQLELENQALVKRIADLLIERDQLAARVNNMRDYMEILLGEPGKYWTKSRAAIVFHETPRASLLKHDADLLAHVAQQLSLPANLDRVALLGEASRLREQAEEES